MAKSRTKVLSNREMELFRKLIWTIKNYQDDITIEEIASTVNSELSFDIDEDDIAECCESIGGSD